MFQASSYIFSFYPSNQLIKEVLLSIFHRRGKLYVFLHLYIKKEKRKKSANRREPTYNIVSLDLDEYDSKH